MSNPIPFIDTATGSGYYQHCAIGDIYQDTHGVRWRVAGRGWVRVSEEPLQTSDNSNPKHAAGMSKPQMNLVPWGPMVSVAKVFELGAKKYGPFNWRDTKVVRSIYVAAALRHQMAMADGQDLDEESGQPHWAHVIACNLIIADAEALGQLIDDRNTKGSAPEFLRRNTVKH